MHHLTTLKQFATHPDTKTRKDRMESQVQMRGKYQLIVHRIPRFKLWLEDTQNNNLNASCPSRWESPKGNAQMFGGLDWPGFVVYRIKEQLLYAAVESL